MEGKSVDFKTFKKIYQQIAMDATYLDTDFFFLNAAKIFETIYSLDIC